MPPFKLAICHGCADRDAVAMEASRRSALMGLGLLPFVVGGCTEWLEPSEARSRAIALTRLSEREAALLEQLGELLLPGATEAGLAHFVDHNLGVAAADSLLMIRYLDVPPPYPDFYRAGLAALEAHAGGRLDEAMVGRLMADEPADWRGPPAPLFLFVVRSDAVDVVYGTRAGLARLGWPVMAHVEPEREWS
jgi:hypothetical protein